MRASGGVMGPALRAPVSAVVFVVDTNPQQIHFLSELRVADGMNIVSTSSRDNPATAIRRDMPDLIIATADRKGFGSLQLCKHLKCDRVTADIPILVLTNACDHVSSAAHELNNPLASIIGHAQLLLRNGGDQGIVERLDIINKEAERARRIVQNLLSFARQHNPCRTEVDVNELLASTLELREYEMEANGVSVRADFGRIPRILADGHQLRQVFLNVIINAEQAIAELGRAGAISVTTGLKETEKGKMIFVTIADNGPGIAPDQITKIFDPFFTTKPVGTGTGLGLSISYGVIEEHKGVISVESQPGSGAAFMIEVPANLNPTTDPF